MNTLDVIGEIIEENPSIDALTFSKYPEQVLLQNRVSHSLTEQGEKFISVALDLRNRLNLPFWDSLMLSFFDQENIPVTLLTSALAHNKNIDQIKTRDIEKIRSLLSAYPGENFSINSKVRFENNIERHLFLLDFHIFPSKANLAIVSNILMAMQLKGYILNSGDSYHFISSSFYELDSLIDLLAKSLLFSPIVDRAWIAHQLIERSCSLRVGLKHGIKPTLVKMV